MGCPVSKDIAAKSIVIEEDNYINDCLNRHTKIITDGKVTAKYNIKSLLGIGTFSEVFYVEEKSTSLPFAIKWMHLNNVQSYETFVAEKRALERIDHPNIVTFKEVLLTAAQDAFIIMELATGGDLFEQIQSKRYLSECECLRVTKMLVSGVDYLHDHGIIHRDLKAENVLYYRPGLNSRIIITDFGFAALRGRHAIMNTSCGTPEYLSPELALKLTYTNKVDIWALGCLVYFMLCGRLPFIGHNYTVLFEKIQKTKPTYSEKAWCMISQSARDFIDACLQKDQEKRSSARELEIQIRESWSPNNDDTHSPHNKSRQIRESWSPNDDDTHSPHNKSRRISLNTFTATESDKMKLKPQPARRPYSANQGVCALNRVKRISDERLPPIDKCLDDSVNIRFNASIQHFRENINNLKNVSTNSSSSSENTSKARRSSLVPNKHRVIKDIILPQNSIGTIIRKEDLFNCSSTMSSSQTSPPSMPDISDMTNLGTNDSDSPISEFDLASTGVVKGDNGPKNSFPAFIQKSHTSHKLPPLRGQMNFNENITSLFIPDNLKVCSFDKSSSSGISKIPTRNNYTYSGSFPSDYTRRSRSTSPQKFMLNQQNSEVKVSSWLKDNDRNNSSTLTYRQTFRNSNAIESKDLAKSF